MDTVIEVKLADGTAQSETIFDKCRELVDRYDKMLSAENGTSDIARFNTSAYGCIVNPEVGQLIETAHAVWELTDGAFDPTTYNATLLWRSAAETGMLPSTEQLADAAAKRGLELISYDPQSGMLRKSAPHIMLDAGGIGKGFAEAALIEYLNTTDAEYGVLSFGGNISVFGKHPGGAFNIALRDPQGDVAIGYLKLTSGFVSVSGGYERYYEIDGERYCHILSPDTGMPAGSELLSATVISQNGAAADALSTAVYVLGSVQDTARLYLAALGSELEFEAVLIFENEIFITSGLEGSFSLLDGHNIKITRIG